MVKNEKIQKFLEEKDNDTALAFLQFLQFFVDNFVEFEEVLEANDKFSFGDGMKKYDRLSSYLKKEYYLAWKDGERLSPELVRNLFKLARREKEVQEAEARRKNVKPEKDTVFRIFHPDDLDEEREGQSVPGASFLKSNECGGA